MPLPAFRSRRSAILISLWNDEAGRDWNHWRNVAVCSEKPGEEPILRAVDHGGSMSRCKFVEIVDGRAGW